MCLHHCIYVPRWKPVGTIGQVEKNSEGVCAVAAARAVRFDFTPVKRALNLFAGHGSLATGLKRRGYSVTSIDLAPSSQGNRVANVLDSDWLGDYSPDEFDVLVACPPSRKTRGVNPTAYDQVALVRRTLEIVEYFQPDKWFLILARNAKGGDWPMLEGYPFVDLDLCQFGEYGFQGPVRVWGSTHVWGVRPRLCDVYGCPNARQLGSGAWEHWGKAEKDEVRREKMRATRPPEFMEYLLDHASLG